MLSAHVVLLRGVNVGSHNRVAMPRLREALGGAGFDDVRTYLQSGNVVLRAAATPDQVERESKRCIHAEFGLKIDIVVRTGQECREIYAWHPEGVARSRLWALLAGRSLGVAATARNWSTVTRLLALVEQD